MGESWVEALKTDDYDSLSLNDKATILFSLCDIAMNSPTIQDTIEKRLEEQIRIKKAKIEEDKAEANLIRLRKQLENLERIRSNSLETQKKIEFLNSQAEGREFDPSKVVDVPKSEAETSLKKRILEAEVALAALTGQSGIEDKDRIQKRTQARAEAAIRSIEKNSVRVEPLGMDRRYNRYWRFASDLPQDINRGRIYVEDTKTGNMSLISDDKSLYALIASLSTNGPRESELHGSLIRFRDDLLRMMPSEAWKIPQNFDHLEQNDFSILDFAPVANEYLKDMGRSPNLGGCGDNCKILTKLKEGLVCIMEALEESQFDANFKKSKYIEEVRKVDNLDNLKEIFGIIECSISKHALHSGYSTEPLLVRGAWISVGAEVATALPGSTAADVLFPTSGASSNGDQPQKDEPNNSTNVGSLHLGWLPTTVHAIGLRIACLDAAIMYSERHCGVENMDAYAYTLRPFALSDSSESLVRSMPIQDNGRVDPTLFPPFPYRLLFSPRIDFAFPVIQFQADVLNGSDALVAANFSKSRLSLGISGRGRRRRGRGRRASTGQRTQKPDALTNKNGTESLQNESQSIDNDRAANSDIEETFNPQGSGQDNQSSSEDASDDDSDSDFEI